MLQYCYAMRYTLCLAMTILLHPTLIQAGKESSSSTGDLVTDLGEIWGQAQKAADRVFLDTYATTATGVDSVGKVMEYGGAAGRVISRLSLTGATVDQQLDSVVSALTCELINKVPASVKIDDIEMREGPAFVCGTKGIMYDMKTLEKVGTRTEDGPAGSVNLHITYKFNNLHFYFESFVQHVPYVKTLVGKLDLHLKENEVELLINIPSVSNLVVNAASGECIVHIKDFKANKLGAARAKLISDSKIRRRVAEKKFNEALENNAEHLEQMKRRIEVKVLLQFQKVLTSSGNWVCKDEGLVNLIKNKGGSMDPPVFSEDFNKYCGNK